MNAREDQFPSAAATEKGALRLWSNLKHRNGLDPMRRYAVAAAVAAATGRIHLLREILMHARAAGTERVPLEESLLQVYLFAGYPRAIEALTVLADIWPRTRRAETIPPQQWTAYGERLCRQVYGRNFEKLNENIADAHPDLREWMVTEGYGKVLSRPGLDSISRELCTVGALTAMHTPRQLQAHILGARNVGATRSQISQAVALGGLGCGTRTWKHSHHLLVQLMGPDEPDRSARRS